MGGEQQAATRSPRPHHSLPGVAHFQSASVLHADTLQSQEWSITPGELNNYGANWSSMPHKVRVSRSETTPGRVMNQHLEKESRINRSGSPLMLITTVLWERVLFLWLSKTSAPFCFIYFSGRFFLKKKTLVAGTAAVIRLFLPICRHGTPGRRMEIHFVAGSSGVDTEWAVMWRVGGRNRNSWMWKRLFGNRKVLFLMQMVVHVSGYWAPQEPLEWNINGPKAWPHFKG